MKTLAIGAFLLLAIPALTEAAPKPLRVSQKRLDAIAEYWKRALSLDDWVVHVQTIPADDMPEGLGALSSWDDGLHRGTILLIDPADYPKRSQTTWIPSDPKGIRRHLELAIVHELVHLRVQTLSRADEDSLEEAEEYTVVRVSEALLKQHRGK